MTDINGFTVENTKVGAFRVNDPDASLTVEGPLIVESLAVDSLTIDGYSLPTAAGTDGQVLTMNADNTTTSFKDITGGVARVWQNVYSMRSPTLGGSKTGDIPITSGGIGSQTLAVDDIPIDSNLKFTVNGLFALNRNLSTDATKVEFKLYITQGGVNNIIPIWDCATSQIGTSTTPVTYRGGYWSLVFYLTRIDSTTLRLASVCCNTDDMQPQQIDVSRVSNSLQTPAFNLPYDITITGSGNIQFQIQTRDLSQNLSTSSVIAQQYTIDLCSSSQSVLATSQTLSGNHLLLSNLNVNGPSGYQDSGHDLMLLSDGSKPLTGSINMNSNNIINCASVQNDSGTEILDFSGGDALLKTNGTLAGVQETNTLNNVAASATVTGVTALAGDAILRSLGTGRILATSSGGGDIEIETKTVLADVKIASNQNMELNTAVDMNLTALNTMTLNSPTILSTGILSMGNNAIINCSSVQDQDRIDIISNVSDVLIQCGQLVPPTPPIVVADFRYDRTQINNNLIVPSINSLTPVGGLSAGTSNSAILTASTAEQSILSATFVGGRQAPANSFKVGDSYTAVLAGNFSSNNGDTLTLRLKAGATGTTILSTIVIPLNASTGVYFELEIDFVIRAIGAAGVADVVSNYDFSYNQSAGGNFQGERKCEVNNTTFDTTILNQLDITAQFSSTNAGNSIQTLLSTLGKTY